MKVKELIEKLSLFPQDLNVIVDGYEDGFDLVTSLSTIKVVRDNWNNKKKEKETSYDGEWSEHPKGDYAVLINSTRR
jgi:hypothetical protein